MGDIAKGKKRFFLTLTEKNVNKLREYQMVTGITETLSEIMEKQIEKMLQEQISIPEEEEENAA